LSSVLWYNADAGAHTDTITALAADSQYLVSTSLDGRLKVWTANFGQLLRTEFFFSAYSVRPLLRSVSIIKSGAPGSSLVVYYTAAKPEFSGGGYTIGDAELLAQVSTVSTNIASSYLYCKSENDTTITFRFNGIGTAALLTEWPSRTTTNCSSTKQQYTYSSMSLWLLVTGYLYRIVWEHALYNTTWARPDYIQMSACGQVISWNRIPGSTNLNTATSDDFVAYSTSCLLAVWISVDPMLRLPNAQLGQFTVRQIIAPAVYRLEMNSTSVISRSASIFSPSLNLPLFDVGSVAYNDAGSGVVYVSLQAPNVTKSACLIMQTDANLWYPLYTFADIPCVTPAPFMRLLVHRGILFAARTSSILQLSLYVTMDRSFGFNQYFGTEPIIASVGNKLLTSAAWSNSHIWADPEWIALKMSKIKRCDDTNVRYMNIIW
jgi:hypothetical protein